MANMEAGATRRRAGEARSIMQQNLRIYQRLQVRQECFHPCSLNPCFDA